MDVRQQHHTKRVATICDDADVSMCVLQVWMITGDKLETAKNIGLACNLIDPDMQARITESSSLDRTIHEFSHSRLIEVTGAWASYAQDADEMGKLFDLVDMDRDGLVQRIELRILLEALMVSEEHTWMYVCLACTARA